MNVLLKERANVHIIGKVFDQTLPVDRSESHPEDGYL